MKKMIGLCVLASFMAASATAQIKKGTVLLGGQIGGGNSKRTFSGTPSIPAVNSSFGNFNVSAGTAIKENKFIGIYGGYSSAKYGYDPTAPFVTTKNHTVSAGVFYRQYKSLGSKFYFFGEANLGYYGGTQKTTLSSVPSGINTQKISGAELGLTPGISYQICKKLQVELTMPSLVNFNYQSSKETSTASTQSSKLETFNANLNTQSGFLDNLAIGFKFTL